MSNNIKKLLCYTWVLVAAILLALAANYYLIKIFPFLSPWFSTLIILAHVFGPLYILDRLKLKARDFNLYSHGLEYLLDKIIAPATSHKYKPDFQTLKADLCFASIWLVIILVPYCLAYYLFFYLKTQNSDYVINFSLTMPPLWGLGLLTQIFAIALPEEFFYRGFLQSSLLKRYAPLSAIIITNLIFAFSHFVGGLAPHRLLTFFPGLIFSWLVYRQHSLTSAIIYHAIFNIVGQILAASIILTKIP